MSDPSDQEITGVATFIYEMGTLKRARRAGWWIAGVRDPESIAEHSHRTAILATILATMEGADPARACLLATFHDSQETRVGDIPHIGRRYLTAAPNEQVTADQVAHCPPGVAETIQRAVNEHEAGSTREALVAHDADKLECLIQAVEYRSTGNGNVQDWIDSCRAALKTASAIRIADISLTMTGVEWRRS